MTGDPSWVRGDIQPNVGMSLDIQGGMSEDDMAEVRRRALPAIAAYRDGGCVPVDLSRDLLQEMMAFLGGRPVEGRLAGLFSTTCSSRGRQRRDLLGRRDPGSQKAESPVVVIGCGMGGILAGIRLSRPGCPSRSWIRTRARGHVVGEPVPGRARRCREPPVLLLLRAGGPLERVLLPAARAPRLLRHDRRQVRTQAALPVRHRSDGGGLAGGPSTGACRCAAQTAPRTCSTPGSSSAPWARSTFPGCPRSPVWTPSPGPRSTRPAGRRTSTSAGPSSPSSAPARAASRSARPSRRGRAAHHLPAHRPVDHPEPAVPHAPSLRG